MENIKSNLNLVNQKCEEWNQQLDQSEANNELINLISENNRLKYRIQILERSIEEEKAKLKLRQNELNSKNNGTPENCLESILTVLEQLFEKAISASYPNIGYINPLIKGSTFVDYQCNVAMSLAKKLKMSPADIARTIIVNTPKNDLISSIKLSLPGFINITISSEYLSTKTLAIVVNDIVIKAEKKEKVIIDYSSPNIAKEMHVGHLRSTIIGDSLANILEFIGHDVVRVNHVGDWGTQFGMLLAHLIEKFPSYKTDVPSIEDLQAFYKESKNRFDTEEDFKKRAYQCVVDFQSKHKDMIQAWKLICDISRKEFQEIYKELDIHNLIERGESFYQDMMKETVDDLAKRGLSEQDEGRVIMFAPNFPLPLIIVKSDGGFTYDTSDLTCLKYRVNEEKADRIIYVTDSGQESHFNSLFDCAKKANYYDSTKVKVEHVGFGVVLGEDKKKFKTRSGETVKLKDLIAKGKERARAKLIEKKRDKYMTSKELDLAQQAVAIGCIKYADLSQDRIKTYEFSFDRMLDDKGNTAVYLLYSLARIRSIIRKTGIDKPVQEIAASLTSFNLSHSRELRLAKHILKFPQIIFQVAKTLYPHVLCSYLFELSVTFSEFYEQCYCIQKSLKKLSGEVETKVNLNRVVLCEATAKILTKGLNLLGIKVLDKM